MYTIRSQEMEKKYAKMLINFHLKYFYLKETRSQIGIKAILSVDTASEEDADVTTFGFVWDRTIWYHLVFPFRAKTTSGPFY